jgi:hypothetical protein
MIKTIPVVVDKIHDPMQRTDTYLVNLKMWTPTYRNKLLLVLVQHKCSIASCPPRIPSQMVNFFFTKMLSTIKPKTKVELKQIPSRLFEFYGV